MAYTSLLSLWKVLTSYRRNGFLRVRWMFSSGFAAYMCISIFFFADDMKWMIMSMMRVYVCIM